MKSPFKFPDSYTREDRAIFFGRDKEIINGTNMHSDCIIVM